MLKNPANLHRAVPITFKQFHYAFTNTLSEADSQAAYDRYAVPVSGRILFQGGLVGPPGWEEVADFALHWAVAPQAGELD